MSSDGLSISARHVTKRYRIADADHAPTSLREAMMRRARHPLTAVRGQHRFTALDDVGFDVGVGEVLGVIGSNGAGKSTLLKVLTRITTIDQGEIRVRGRMGSLLEVGTGFHPELTGRENVFLNGTVLGMRQSEIRRRFDEIVDFAEVGEFVDTPIKRFSSGMQVRLAFSVAVHLDAEILLVDEVLAVGDASFQRRCTDKIEEVSRGEGRTVLFVSHNMATIRTVCQRVLVLARGRVHHLGDTPDAVEAYLGTSVDDSSGAWDLTQREGRTVLTSLRVIGADHRPTSRLRAGDSVTIRIAVDQPVGLARPVVGLRITNDVDVAIATFVAPASVVLAAASTGGEVELAVPALPLTPGRYGLDVWVIDTERWTLVDLATRAGSLEVESPGASLGDYQARHGDGAVTIGASWSVWRRCADESPATDWLTG